MFSNIKSYLQLASVTFLLLSPQWVASNIDSHDDSEHFYLTNDLLKRDVATTAPSCSFYITPGGNTTCASILATWNLNSTGFLNLNPYASLWRNVTTDCIGIIPGRTYCVAGGATNQISTDGSCGPNNGNKVCPGSTFGNCCSVNGWCGNGYDFCGIGNCISGQCVNGTGWSLDGKCGINPGDRKCGGKYGVCCSNAGWCGNGTTYCAYTNCAAGACSPLPSSSLIKSTTTGAQGCVAGACWTSVPPTGPVAGTTASATSAKSSTSTMKSSSSTSTAKTSSTSTKTTSTASATPTSVDGSCGGTKALTCAGTTFGNCCSSAGYCGSTGVFCGEGCQTKFSSGCQTTNISSNNGRCGVISGSPTYTCVGGQFDGQCCSSGGYCGSTTAHCGTGCQKSYGKCT